MINFRQDTIAAIGLFPHPLPEKRHLPGWCKSVPILLLQQSQGTPISKLNHSPHTHPFQRCFGLANINNGLKIWLQNAAVSNSTARSSPWTVLSCTDYLATKLCCATSFYVMNSMKMRRITWLYHDVVIMINFVTSHVIKGKRRPRPKQGLSWCCISLLFLQFHGGLR